MRKSQAGQSARVAVLTNSPAPYRDQLFDRLNAEVEHFRVYYTQHSAEERRWAVAPVASYQLLGVVVRLGSLGPVNRGLLRLVRSSDVVFVGGYEQPSYIITMLLCRLMRRRCVLFFDGVAPSRLHRAGGTERVKRLIVRLPNLVLANGAVGRAYMTSLGVPTDRIFNQYLVPLQASETGPSPEASGVLFLGRLATGKGLERVIQAAASLPNRRFTIAGDGPLRASLEATASGLPNVGFVGEVGRGRIASLFEGASCLLLLATNEVWGLVVQEAIQHDVPVIVSDDVGCAADLVIEGVNGFRLRDVNAESVAAAILKADALDRRQLQEANRRILAEWNIDRHAQAFLEAIGR